MVCNNAEFEAWRPFVPKHCDVETPGLPGPYLVPALLPRPASARSLSSTQTLAGEPLDLRLVAWCSRSYIPAPHRPLSLTIASHSHAILLRRRSQPQPVGEAIATPCPSSNPSPGPGARQCPSRPCRLASGCPSWESREAAMWPPSTKGPPRPASSSLTD